MFVIVSVLFGVALSLRFNVLMLAPAMAAASAISVGIGLTLGDEWLSILVTVALVIVGLQLGYVAGVIIQAVMTPLPAVARPVGYPPIRSVAVTPESLAHAAIKDQKPQASGSPVLVDFHSRPPLHSHRSDTASMANSDASLQHAEVTKGPLSRTLCELAAEMNVNLDEALRNDWLELCYQPKADPRSLVVFGAEAFIRVRHPSWGVAMPLRYLRTESSAPTRALWEFAVGQALTDWIAFAEERMPVEVAISVPLAILKNLDFMHFARKHMPIDPRFPGLIAVIREAEAIRDGRLINDTAMELLRHNIRLSIDDLTPNSKFWNEKDLLPFSELKVGQRFVSGCAHSGFKRGVCQTIVDAGHRINAQTVAVGVETQEDLTAVREIRFDVAQGSLLGAPMTRHEFVTRAPPAVRIGGAASCRHRERIATLR